MRWRKSSMKTLSVFEGGMLEKEKIRRDENVEFSYI